MTDQKLTSRTSTSALTDTDLFMVVTDVATTPVTKKIDWQYIQSQMASDQAASTSEAGMVELATIAETTTGTATSLAVTPDGLAGSVFGKKSFGGLIQSGTLTTGDGKVIFGPIPSQMSGMNLIEVIVVVKTASTSGLPTFQFARGRQPGTTSSHSYVDMLTTRVTIDTSEYDSQNAAATYLIDTSNDDLITGDLIRVDCDVAGSGTADAYATLTAQLP